MSNQNDMLKMLINNKNPKDIIQQIAIQNSNPIVNNLVSMAQKGDTQGVENFARNICKEKGIDFDAEFSNFMNNFKQGIN